MIFNSITFFSVIGLALTTAGSHVSNSHSRQELLSSSHQSLSQSYINPKVTISLFKDHGKIFCDHLVLTSIISFWNQSCFQQAVKEEYIINITTTLNPLTTSIIDLTKTKRKEYHGYLIPIENLPHANYPILSVFGGSDWFWTETHLQGFPINDQCKYESKAYPGLIHSNQIIQSKNDPWIIQNSILYVNGMNSKPQAAQQHPSPSSILPMSQTFLSTAALIAETSKTCANNIDQDSITKSISITLTKKMMKPIVSDTLDSFNIVDQFVVFPRGSTTSCKSVPQVCKVNLATTNAALTCAKAYAEDCYPLITGLAMRVPASPDVASAGITIVTKSKTSTVGIVPGFLIKEIGGTEWSEGRIVSINLGLKKDNHPNGVVTNTIPGCDAVTLYMVEVESSGPVTVSLDKLVPANKIGTMLLSDNFVAVNALITGKKRRAIVAVPDKGFNVCQWYQTQLIHKPSIVVEMDVGKPIKSNPSKNQDGWNWDEVMIELNTRPVFCDGLERLSIIKHNEDGAEKKLKTILDNLLSVAHKHCLFKLKFKLKLPNSNLDLIPLIKPSHTTSVGYYPGFVFKLPTSFTTLRLDKIPYNINEVNFKLDKPCPDLSLYSTSTQINQVPIEPKRHPYTTHYSSGILTTQQLVFSFSKENPIVQTEPTQYFVYPPPSSTDDSKCVFENKLVKEPVIEIESSWIDGASLGSMSAGPMMGTIVRYEIESENCRSDFTSSIICSNMRTLNQVEACLRDIESSRCSVKIIATIDQPVNSLGVNLGASGILNVPSFSLKAKGFSEGLKYNDATFRFHSVRISDRFFPYGSCNGFDLASTTISPESTRSQDQLTYYPDLETSRMEDNLVSLIGSESGDRIDSTFTLCLIPRQPKLCSWNPKDVKNVRAVVMLETKRFLNIGNGGEFTLRPRDDFREELTMIFSDECSTTPSQCLSKYHKLDRRTMVKCIRDITAKNNCKVTVQAIQVSNQPFSPRRIQVKRDRKMEEYDAISFTVGRLSSGSKESHSDLQYLLSRVMGSEPRRQTEIDFSYSYPKDDFCRSDITTYHIQSDGLSYPSITSYVEDLLDASITWDVTTHQINMRMNYPIGLLYSTYVVFPNHGRKSGCILDKGVTIKSTVQYDLENPWLGDKLWSSESVITNIRGCQLRNYVNPSLFQNAYMAAYSLDQAMLGLIPSKDCIVDVKSIKRPHKGLIQTHYTQNKGIEIEFDGLFTDLMVSKVTAESIISIDLNIKSLSTDPQCNKVSKITMKTKTGNPLLIKDVKGESTFDDEITVNYDLKSVLNQVDSTKVTLWIQSMAPSASTKCVYSDGYPTLIFTSTYALSEEIEFSIANDFKLFSTTNYKIVTLKDQSDSIDVYPLPECISDTYHVFSDLAKCILSIPTNYKVGISLELALPGYLDDSENNLNDVVPYIIPPINLNEFIRSQEMHFVLAEVVTKITYDINSPPACNDIQLTYELSKGKITVIPAKWNGKDRFVLTKPMEIQPKGNLYLAPRVQNQNCKRVLLDPGTFSLVFVTKEVVNADLDLYTTSNSDDFLTTSTLTSENCDMTKCQTPHTFKDDESLRDCLMKLMPGSGQHECTVTIDKVLNSNTKKIIPTNIDSILTPAIMLDSKLNQPIYGQAYQLTGISFDQSFSGPPECNKVNLHLANGKDLIQRINQYGLYTGSITSHISTNKLDGQYELTKNELLVIKPTTITPNTFIYASPVVGNPKCTFSNSFKTTMKFRSIVTLTSLKVPSSKSALLFVERQMLYSDDNLANFNKSYPCSQMSISPQLESQLITCHSIISQEKGVDLRYKRMLILPENSPIFDGVYIAGKHNKRVPAVYLGKTIEGNDPLRPLNGLEMQLDGVTFVGNFEPDFQSTNVYKTEWSPTGEMAMGTIIGVSQSTQVTVEPGDLSDGENAIYLMPANEQTYIWFSAANPVVSVISTAPKKEVKKLKPAKIEPVDSTSREALPLILWRISGCLSIQANCNGELDLTTLNTCLRTIQNSREVCQITLNVQVIWNNLLKPLKIQGLNDMVLLSLKTDQEESKLAELLFGGKPLTLTGLHLGGEIVEHGSEATCRNNVAAAFMHSFEGNKVNFDGDPFAKDSSNSNLIIFASRFKTDQALNAPLQSGYNEILFGFEVSRKDCHMETVKTAYANLEVTFDNSFSSLGSPYNSDLSVNDWTLTHRVESINKITKLSRQCETARTHQEVARCLNSSNGGSSNKAKVTIQARNVHLISGFNHPSYKNVGAIPIFTIGNYRDLSGDLEPIVKGFNPEDEIVLTDIFFSQVTTDCGNGDLLLGELGPEDTPIWTTPNPKFKGLTVKRNIHFDAPNQPKLLLNKPNVIAIAFSVSNCNWIGSSVSVRLQVNTNPSSDNSPWNSRLSYIPTYRVLFRSPECNQKVNCNIYLNKAAFVQCMEDSRAPGCVFDVEMQLKSVEKIQPLKIAGGNAAVLAVIDKIQINQVEDLDLDIIGVQLKDGAPRDCKFVSLNIMNKDSIPQMGDDLLYGIAYGFTGTNLDEGLTFSKPHNIENLDRLILVGHLAKNDCKWTKGQVVVTFRKRFQNNPLPDPFSIRNMWRQTYQLSGLSETKQNVCGESSLTPDEITKCYAGIPISTGLITSEAVLEPNEAFSGVPNELGVKVPAIVTGLNDVGKWIYDVILSGGIFTNLGVQIEGLDCPAETPVDSVHFLESVSPIAGKGVLALPAAPHQTLKDYKFKGFGFSSRENINGIIYATMNTKSCRWIKTTKARLSLGYAVQFDAPSLHPVNSAEKVILRWLINVVGGCKNIPPGCEKPMRDHNRLTDCLNRLKSESCIVSVTAELTWVAQLATPQQEDDFRTPVSAVVLPSEKDIGVDLTEFKIGGKEFKLSEFQMAPAEGVHLKGSRGRIYQGKKSVISQSTFNIKQLNLVTTEEFSTIQSVKLNRPVPLRKNEPVFAFKTKPVISGWVPVKAIVMPVMRLVATEINNSAVKMNMIEAQNAWVVQYSLPGSNCKARSESELEHCLTRTVAKKPVRVRITATLSGNFLKPLEYLSANKTKQTVPGVVLGRYLPQLQGDHNEISPSVAEKNRVGKYLSTPLEGSNPIELKELRFDGIFINGQNPAVSLKEIKYFDKTKCCSYVENDLESKGRGLFSANPTRLLLGNGEGLLVADKAVSFIAVPIAPGPFLWKGGSVTAIFETTMTGGPRIIATTTSTVSINSGTLSGNENHGTSSSRDLLLISQYLCFSTFSFIYLLLCN